MAMEILRPTSITEALQAGAVPGTAWLGGGTWIAARRGDPPRVLVSLERLGLDHIRCEGSSCTIGAAVTFQQVLDGPGVPEVLRQAVAATASRTLRGMATVGGELGLLPPSSALVPALIALGARLALAGRKRPLEMGDYCLMRPAGLILEVTIPDGPVPCALRTLARTSHSTRSLVVALAARALAPAVSGLRAVASDCRGQILRLAGFEKALEGAALPARERIEAMVRGAFSPREDMHASAAYKAHLAGVFAADILHDLAAGGARP